MNTYTTDQQQLLEELVASYVQLENAEGGNGFLFLGEIENLESQLLELNLKRSDIASYVDSYFAHAHARTQNAKTGEQKKNDEPAKCSKTILHQKIKEVLRVRANVITSSSVITNKTFTANKNAILGEPSPRKRGHEHSLSTKQQ